MLARKICATHLVDPSINSTSVREHTLLTEPEGNLLLGRFHTVRSVADVATDIDGEVATDGTRSRCKGVCGTEKSTALLHDVLALEDDGNDRSGGHVLDQPREERLSLQVGVVLLETRISDEQVHRYTAKVHLLLLRGMDLLQGNDLVATLLETANDLTDETTLDAVRLHHDVSWRAVCVSCTDGW